MSLCAHMWSAHHVALVFVHRMQEYGRLTTRWSTTGNNWAVTPCKCTNTCFLPAPRLKWPFLISSCRPFFVSTFLLCFLFSSSSLPPSFPLHITSSLRSFNLCSIYTSFLPSLLHPVFSSSPPPFPLVSFPFSPVLCSLIVYHSLPSLPPSLCFFNYSLLFPSSPFPPSSLYTPPCPGVSVFLTLHSVSRKL